MQRHVITICLKIYLVGTNRSISMVILWKETGVPKVNPPVWWSCIISLADARDRTRVLLVRDQSVNHWANRTTKYLNIYCRLSVITLILNFMLFYLTGWLHCLIFEFNDEFISWKFKIETTLYTAMQTLHIGTLCKTDDFICSALWKHALFENTGKEFGRIPFEYVFVYLRNTILVHVTPHLYFAGMNIFVAFFVLLLLLSESTPKAAESIPLIGE